MVSFSDIIINLPAKYDVAEDPEFLEIRLAETNDPYVSIPEVIVTMWNDDVDSDRVLAMYYPFGFELDNEKDSIITWNIDRFLAFLKRNLG